MDKRENQTTDKNDFQKPLLFMMNRRWLMTLVVLVTFMSIAVGILISIHTGSEVSGEWKELLLLLLGALIGSYGKIIDYWFSDKDKDNMLVGGAKDVGNTIGDTVNKIKPPKIKKPKWL